MPGSPTADSPCCSMVVQPLPVDSQQDFVVGLSSRTPRDAAERRATQAGTALQAWPQPEVHAQSDRALC